MLLGNHSSTPVCNLCGSSRYVSKPLPPSKPPLLKEDSFGKKALNKALEESSCSVCMDFPQNAITVPCGHNACCIDCAKKIMGAKKICPICSGNNFLISSNNKIFLTAAFDDFHSSNYRNCTILSSVNVGMSCYDDIVP
jgi:hypothetical protein